ncbi:MAG: hypothetical protein AB9869_19595 [Verrucomicrobiia bacterium]
MNDSRHFFPYSRDSERGSVRDVTYSDVSVLSRHPPRSHFSGFDSEHTVERVTIDGLSLNGRHANTAAEAHLSFGQNVSDVRFGRAARIVEE